MRRIGITFIVSMAAMAALPSLASATLAPTTGETTTTLCSFDPQDGTAGVTSCRTQTVRIYGSSCSGPGERLYFEEDIDSVRNYQGNVVLRNFNGVVVEDAINDPVRAHARLLYDSGPHAFGFGFYASDASCT